MKQAYGKYILALLLFGSNGVVASAIALNSYEIVLLRTFIGSLFLVCIFLLSPKAARPRGSRRDFLFLAGSGVAMGASWMFLYEAYTQVGVSVATLAYYCGPVLVMILAPVLFREAMTKAKIIGFVCVLAGMVLVNRQELGQGVFSWGLLCGLLAAVLYTFMVVCNKKATGITGLANATCQLCFSFLAVAVFTVARQGLALTIAPADIWPILLLGLVNTGVGCYLYFSAIPRLPAQSVAICGYLEPVSALLFSAAFLGERLAVWQWAGTALILGGAACGELLTKPKERG